MKEIMPVIKTGERVLFLCDPGQGPKIVQRIRVMMSRARKELKKKKRRMQHFRVRHSIHKHTENGKRHDCVVIWSERSESHLHQELLEDLLSHD